MPMHLVPTGPDVDVYAIRPAGKIYHLSHNTWQFVPHFILDSAAPERSTAAEAHADADIYVRTFQP